MTDASHLRPLTRALATVLVVDLQQKLLPAMHEADSCVAAAARLIKAAGTLGVPVIATEQYPAGLGRTDPRISELLAANRTFEKTQFSAWIEPVRAVLAHSGRNQVILVGIETHVCVQQTALDLLRDGKQVWLCVDAVTSRRPLDSQVACDRLRHAGAIVTTTESVIFELLGEAGTQEFKNILKIVK